MTHACNPAFGRQIQEGRGFEDSLEYLGRLWFKQRNEKLASCRENKTFCMGLSQVTFSII